MSSEQARTPRRRYLPLLGLALVGLAAALVYLH